MMAAFKTKCNYLVVSPVSLFTDSIFVWRHLLRKLISDRLSNHNVMFNGLEQIQMGFRKIQANIEVTKVFISQ